MKTLKRSLSLVLVVLLLAGLMSVAASALQFNDYTDKTTVQYKTAVGVLTGMNILEGTNGAFRPTDTVTRAEAAAMIVRAILGRDAADKLPTKNPSTFTDMPTTHWANKYVEYGVEHKLINGVGNNLFNPNGQVTGYEFAKMILGALGYNKNNEFTGGNWALEVAKVAITGGIFEDLIGNVDPNNAAKREECALYLYNGMTKMYYVEYSSGNGTYTPVLDPNGGFMVSIAVRIYNYEITLSRKIIDNAWTNKNDSGKTVIGLPAGAGNTTRTFGVDTDLSLVNHNVKIHYGNVYGTNTDANNVKNPVYYVEDVAKAVTVTTAINGTSTTLADVVKRAGFKDNITTATPYAALLADVYNTLDQAYGTGLGVNLAATASNGLLNARGQTLILIDNNDDGYVDIIEQVTSLFFAKLDNITITSNVREFTFTVGTEFTWPRSFNASGSGSATNKVYSDYVKTNDTLTINKYYLIEQAYGTNATINDGMFVIKEAPSVTGQLTKISYTGTSWADGWYTIGGNDYQAIGGWTGNAGANPPVIGVRTATGWVPNYSVAVGNSIYSVGTGNGPWDGASLANLGGTLPKNVTAYLAPDGSIIAFTTSSATKYVYVSNLDWTSSNLASTQGLTAHVWFADGTADGQYYVDQTAAGSAMTGYYYNWNFYGNDNSIDYVNINKNEDRTYASGHYGNALLGLYEFTDLGNGKCALREIQTVTPVLSIASASGVTPRGGTVGNATGTISSVNPGISTVGTGTYNQATDRTVFFYVSGSEAKGTLKVEGKIGFANALKPSGLDIEAYGSGTGPNLTAALFPGVAGSATDGVYFMKVATTGATLNPRLVTEYSNGGTTTKYYVDVYDMNGDKQTLVIDRAVWEGTTIFTTFTANNSNGFFKVTGNAIKVLAFGASGVSTWLTESGVNYSTGNVNTSSTNDNKFNLGGTIMNYFQGTDNGTITVNLVSGSRTMNTVYKPADGSTINNWVKNGNTVTVATASVDLDGSAFNNKLNIVFILSVS